MGEGYEGEGAPRDVETLHRVADDDVGLHVLGCRWIC